MQNSLKKTLFLLLGVYLLATNDARLMDEDEENEISQGLSHSRLKLLPPELIVVIGNYLYEDDFRAFSLSSKYIYQALINDKRLFFPEDDEKAIRTIQSTPFDSLEWLTLKWSRNKKHQLLSSLKGISHQFSNHEYSIPMSSLDYEQKMSNFAVDIKCKMMLFYLKDDQIEQEIVNMKESKINAYYYDSPELDDSPETVELMTTQGIIVSQQLLQCTQERARLELPEKATSKSLDKQKIFLPITEFFKKFKTLIEDII